MEKLNDTTSKKAIEAVRDGAPRDLAFALIGLTKGDVLYMERLSDAYEVYKEKSMIERMKAKSQGILTDIRQKAYEDAQTTKADPEIVKLIETSALVMREARELNQFMCAIKEAESDAVVYHLKRIKKGDKFEVDASKWFLDRALPDPKEEQGVALPSINVQFVSPDTEETKKRLEMIEAEVTEGVDFA